MDCVFMRKFMLLLAAIGAAAASAPAGAQPMRDSRERQEAFRGVRQGDILPLNVIRDRIGARLPGAVLIGADLIGGMVYRLRYMRGANVIMVDVDARTGQPLRCFGC
jgi:hypothetical protein